MKKPGIALMIVACVFLFTSASRSGHVMRRNTEKELLASWHEGETKQAIVKFVEGITRENTPGFVPPSERIAVFDNDGTLWCEQPFYFQGLFVFERVFALVDKHPEWNTTQPFQAVLEQDWKTLATFGQKELLELVMATHSGMTTGEFEQIVREWLATAKHPKFERPYTALVYQPMLELLSYLRANAFKVFIVSGGGIEFVRTFSERVYGIPPEQVVGSSIVTEFKLRDGIPVLVRQPQLNFFDDREGKPVAINQHLGRRPIMAFGNSDGDLAMFQWTAAGDGERLIALIPHTDDEREYAYDKGSPAGGLDRALDEATKNNWLVVDMKKDWKRIFPFEEK